MPDPRRLLLTALFALPLSMFAPVPGAGQDIGSHARIVQIRYLQGSVQFNDQPAVINTPVTEGSRIITGTDGLAEVQFEDSTTIRLASETDITFAQLARLSTGEALTRVDLDDGEAEFLVPASSAGRFAVNAHGKNILFKQPGRFRILSINSSPLEIAAWKGEAGVRDLETGQEVSVRDHETFTLNPDDPEQYNLESSVLGDDLDRWSEQRDQDLSGNYVSSYTSSTPVYDQYQSGGYGPSYGYTGYPFGAYASCYGYGFGSWQPLWAVSPGYCWNSGFFYNPWFFSPPVAIVIFPPIRPRRPGPIRPPTIPVATKIGTPVGTTVRPEYRSFRDQGEGRRLFNDQTFQRTVNPETEAKVGEATHTPGEPAITPGQRSGNNTESPTHVTPSHSTPTSGSSSHHTSYSPPHGSSGSGGSSHSSSPGSHGFSGGASHSSGSSSHSSGGGRSR